LVSQSGFTAIQPSKAREWNKSGNGKTNLKTSVVMEDADGNEIAVNELNPMPTWDYLPPNSVIKYEIETLSDGVGKDDKVQMDIIYDNRAAIIREYKAQVNQLSPKDKEAFDNGSKVMYDRVIKLTEQAVIDKSIPSFVTIYSKTITTDKNGKASGTITIPPNWPNSIYDIMFHYGYDGVGEALTETDIFIEDAYNAISWAVAGAIIIGTGGAALAPYLAVAGTVMLIGEVSYGLAEAYLWTSIAGTGTENKHGANFPMMGFNHAYGFGRDERTLEKQGGSSPTLDVGSPYFLIGGGIIVLLILRRLL